MRGRGSVNGRHASQHRAYNSGKAQRLLNGSTVARRGQCSAKCETSPRARALYFNQPRKSSQTRTHSLENALNTRNCMLKRCCKGCEQRKRQDLSPKRPRNSDASALPRDSAQRRGPKGGALALSRIEQICAVLPYRRRRRKASQELLAGLERKARQALS